MERIFDRLLPAGCSNSPVKRVGAWCNAVAKAKGISFVVVEQNPAFAELIATLSPWASSQPITAVGEPSA